MVITLVISWIALSVFLCLIMSAKKLKLSERERALENDEQAARLLSLMTQHEGSAVTA